MSGSASFKLYFEPQVLVALSSPIPNLLKKYLQTLKVEFQSELSWPSRGQECLASLFLAASYFETVLKLTHNDAVRWNINAGHLLEKEDYTRMVFQERFDRLAFHDKVKDVATLRNVSIDLGQRPWQDITFMFQLRIILVHGNIEPEVLLPLDMVIEKPDLATTEPASPDFPSEKLVETVLPVLQTIADLIKTSELREVEHVLETHCKRFFQLAEDNLSWQRILSNSCGIWTVETALECAAIVEKWGNSK